VKTITRSTSAELDNPSQSIKPEFSQIIESFLSDPSVSSGKMFGSIALKTNGKVFAMQVKGELVVKLPRADVDQLVVSNAGRYFDPGHGKLMKEWVAVASGKTPWLPLAKAAHRFLKGGSQ
jgi:hypothetical protein